MVLVESLRALDYGIIRLMGFVNNDKCKMEGTENEQTRVPENVRDLRRRGTGGIADCGGRRIVIGDPF